MTKGVILFRTLTSLHMGSGRTTSYVDLPVQREVHTNFPIMGAPGIKGVLRDFAERKWEKEEITLIFGKEENPDFASPLIITDGRILAFPVRSLKGIFALITCPYVLHRFCADVGINNVQIPDPEDDKKVIVGPDSVLVFSKDGSEKLVVLEEFVLEKENKPFDSLGNVLNKYLRSESLRRLAVVSDTFFSYMVLHQTEIRTRIAIDQEKGTVKEKALFTEEFIPSEAVFYSTVFFEEPFIPEDIKDVNIKTADDVADKFKSLLSNEAVLFMGGDTTIGAGLVEVKYFDVNNKGGGA